MQKRVVHLVSIAAPFRLGWPDMTRPPSALLYVGGYLSNHEFPVKIWHIDEGAIADTVAKISDEKNILFVGFSVLTGKQVTLSAIMSAELKSRNEKLNIVWGGIHPSLMPRECLQMGNVDYVVIGEGERTILELAQALESKVRVGPNIVEGLAFKIGDQICVGSDRKLETDLDQFRQDWSLVDVKRYVRQADSEPTFCFITSRGCPHNCGFCYNLAFNKRKWRGHSVDFVINELLWIKRQTSIKAVSFDDDNFFTIPRRALEILRRLRSNDIRCSWLEIRLDDITNDILKEIEALGISTIFVGWESGSRHTLDRISKGFTPELIREKMEMLSNYKQIKLDASAIMGFPWENQRDIRDTTRMAIRMFNKKPYQINFNLGTYIPYPGTPIAKEALDAGFKFPDCPEGWINFDILEGTMKVPWLTSREITNLMLLDRYAKMLCVSDKSRPFRKQLRLFFAGLAYIRIVSGILIFPWEVYLHDWRHRQLLERSRLEGSRGYWRLIENVKNIIRSWVT